MGQTQADRVYEFMRHNGEISQRDAYKMGIYRLAAVIFDMKEAGLLIKTEIRTVRNQDGTKSRVGFYSLLNNDTYQMKLDI